MWADGPLHRMVILEIPDLRAHIRQTRCWQMASLQIPTIDASYCRQKQFLFISQADKDSLTDMDMIAHPYMIGRWNVP